MRQEPKCAPCGCRLTYSLSHSRLLCLNWKIITEDGGISLSKVWLRNISSKMSFGWLQLHSEACFFIYTVDTDKSDFDRKTFMIWMKLINVMWCEGVFTYSRVRLCLCSPDPYVAVLLTPIPVRPVCDSMWDSQCVDVFRKREETHLAPHTHCSAKTAKRSWLLLVWALQKSPTLMSTNSQLMVFIPLAMLDTLPLSPQPKHIMGWVSFYLDIYLIYSFIHSFHHTLFFIFIQWGSRSLIIHQLFFFFILSFSFLSLPGFPWFPLSGSGSSSVIRDGPRARVARRVL